MPSPATEKGFHAGREPANKGQTYPPEVLTEAEVRRLIEACSNRAPTGIRNRALIVAMYRGGLRVGEALALRPKDLHPSAGALTVLHGKGDRRRVVGLDPGAVAILSRWVETRHIGGINGHAPLFCTLKARPLQPSYVRTLLPRLADKAGIEKRVHPHGLRHTHAYELMMEGVPVPIIQQQLGHTSLATTDRYVSHLAPVDLISHMKERHSHRQMLRSPPETTAHMRHLVLAVNVCTDGLLICPHCYQPLHDRRIRCCAIDLFRAGVILVTRWALSEASSLGLVSELDSAVAVGTAATRRLSSDSWRLLNQLTPPPLPRAAL